jgi:acylphosphatase
MVETDVRLHAVVEGRVQGVGFRSFVLEHAGRLGLKGWVRNTYQGEVEVLAEGPRTRLDQLYDLLSQGPYGSYVITVRPDWSPANGEFDRFIVARTI